MQDWFRVSTSAQMQNAKVAEQKLKIETYQQLASNPGLPDQLRAIAVEKLKLFLFASSSTSTSTNSIETGRVCCSDRDYMHDPLQPECDEASANSIADEVEFCGPHPQEIKQRRPI